MSSLQSLISHRSKVPLAALAVMDLLFFSLTDPHRIPVGLLMVGFGLTIANLYFLMRGVLLLTKWYGLSFGVHSARIAGVLTGVIASLIALQSIDQLTPRDIIVLLPFAVIAYMYTSYGRSSADS